jgi:1-phosphatidylinositol-4-phosphate 5-kinase
LAPKIFFNIRHYYGIKNEEYLKSLGPENFLGNLLLTKNRSLREMCSTGKSGSFFYYSYDNKYVLKTISIAEFEFFKLILEDYYFYLKNNENTLLQRFFGLHTIIFNDIKMHFVIMNNVFNSNIKINYKYDLKGSSYSRLSRDHNDINYERYDFNIPMKDLDLEDRKECFYLESDQVYALYDQMKSDSEFLASKNINDYSLLIGVHEFGRLYKFFFKLKIANKLIKTFFSYFS